MPANNEQTKAKNATATEPRKEKTSQAGSGGQGARANQAARSDEGVGMDQAGGNGADQGVLAQAQESGRDIASKSIEAIGERTRTATAGYKSDISAGLHTLADGLRQTSSTVQDAAEDKPISTAGAKYIEDIAKKIEAVSDYFERSEAGDVVQDLKGFARRNPTVFVGGAFALGFALSRLLRSAENENTTGAGAR